MSVIWGLNSASREQYDRVLSAFALKGNGGRKYRSFALGQAEGRIYSVRALFEDSPAARNQVMLSHDVKERLFDYGFSRIDRFRLSFDGEPFVSHSGQIYVAERRFDMQETDFADPQSIMRAIDAVAQMHSIFVKAPIASDSFVEQNQACPDDAQKRFLAARDALNRVVKRARSGRRLSDFDVYVLKNQEFYMRQLDEWRDAATGSGLYERLWQAQRQGMIVHNDLREESLLCDGSSVAVIDFLKCSRGYFLTDLASMIGRHFRSALKPVPAAKIVEVYLKRNPLDKRHIDNLYALLKYPGKFMSVCESFYEKKRTFTPVAFLSRIEKLTSAQNTYTEYIRSISED